MIGAIKAAEIELGGRCELAVIDTVARAMNGAKENDSSDMSAFVDRCARIQEATGAHALLVHHSGKEIGKGARGSNALLGAVDTEVEIANGVIEATKESEKELPKPLRFVVEGVALGENQAGELVTAAFANIGAARAFQVMLTPAEMTYFEAFDAAQEKLIVDEDGDQNPPVPGAQWNAEADSRIPAGETRGKSRGTRNDMRRSLAEKGWIVKSARKPSCFERAAETAENGGV